MLWFYDNHPWFAKPGEERSLKGFKPKFFFACSVLALLISIAVTPLGLYSAIQSIIDGYRAGSFAHPFAC
jgi:hypothetical protein